MIKNIKGIFVLVAICAVISVLLALTNSITAPIIEKNQNAAANSALLAVMPDGKSFEEIDLSAYTLPASVTEVQKETDGLGYVIKMNTAGYAQGMVIMCGVGADGIVTGAVCLSSNETLGKEKTYGENFAGKDAAGVDAADTISGATKTTQAYKNAIKDAINASIILGGGSVDIRTEEEILLDNLCTALPSGNGEFTKEFICESIEGVSAIYSANNESGFVCVIGESFVGVDADGVAHSDDAELAKTASDAVLKIKATELEAIDISLYPDVSSFVVSAHKTATGNYVIETKGAGYGIKGGNEYHPASGEYIIVRVSVDQDGKIIDCLTVSEGETDGLGDACADEKFYGQFDGKTADDYTEIDAISGATMTTNGYKQAIERAFAAFRAFTGGAR